MAEFLSPEWVAALDEAARGSTELIGCAGDDRLVIEQRVAMPDGSERAHHLVLGSGPARVGQGRADTPDVVLTTDLGTARDLALGNLDAQRALEAGLLRVSGAVEALVGRGQALPALDDVFGAVRAGTSFAPEDAATVASAE